MDESVLVKVSGHKLLLYEHFSTYFDNSYTIVKVSPLELQNGPNTTVGAFLTELWVC
jgi:hypothetical protein